ncbi:MAG: hypothetical protein JJU36_12225 [Phycisphaeraceae bacterium]|nr:hypothetical protein [Phycisphaeraceae bacterium]
MSEAISQSESEPTSPVETDASDVGDAAIRRSEPDPIEPDAVLSACKRWLALGVDPYIIARRFQKKFGSVIAQQAELWTRRAREAMLASLNVPREQRTAEAVWFYKYIISHPKATISQKLRARIRIDQLIGLTPMPTPRTHAPGPGNYPGCESFSGRSPTTPALGSALGSVPTSGSSLGTPGWGSAHRAGNPAGSVGSALGSEPRCAADAPNPERFGDGASETIAERSAAGDEPHNDQVASAAQDRPSATQDSANTRSRQRSDDRCANSPAADRLACESTGVPGGSGDFPASRKASQGISGGTSGGGATGGGTSGGISRRLSTRAQRRAEARQQRKAARRAARSAVAPQPMAGPIPAAQDTRPAPAAQERAPP